VNGQKGKGEEGVPRPHVGQTTHTVSQKCAMEAIKLFNKIH